MRIEELKVNKKLKIVFMGTPAFSVPVLEGLLQNYKLRAIVTQPDRKGKDGEMIPPPVKKIGMEHTILVLQPEKISEAVE